MDLHRMRGRVVGLILAAALAAGLRGAQAQTPEPAPPPPETDRERLERLERELKQTRADLEEMRKLLRQQMEPPPKAPEKAEPSAPPPAAKPPGALPRADELSGDATGIAFFEKKWGKQAVLTWDNGFFFRFLDPEAKDPADEVVHSLHVGGLIQADARFYGSPGHPQDDTLLLRRARILANGTFFRRFDYQVEYDLGNNTADLKDAWINLRLFPWLQVRAGNFKLQMMREQVNSDKYIDFIERPLPFGVYALDRDIGLMVHGETDLVNYAVQLTEGRGSNLRDNNDDKDILVRVGVTPLRGRSDLAQDVEVAGSYSYGHEEDFVPSFQTYAGTSFLNLNTVAVGGRSQQGPRERAGAEVTVPIGPFKVQFDYVFMRLDDLFFPSGKRKDIEVHDMVVDVMYMLTGEWRRVNRRVIPKENFNPLDLTWGAFEVGARFEQMRTDQGLRRFTRDGAGTNQTEIMTLGLNWYWNPLMKFVVNYYRAWFDEKVLVNVGNTSRFMKAEDVFLIRWQLEF